MWRWLFCTLSGCLASRKAGIAQKRMKVVEMINDSFPSLDIVRSSSRVEYILIVICRKYERLFNRQWGHTGLINNAREWRLFASLTNGTFWEQSKINQRQVTTRGGREGIRGKTNWSFVDLGDALGSWSLFHEESRDCRVLTLCDLKTFQGLGYRESRLSTRACSKKFWRCFEDNQR